MKNFFKKNTENKTLSYTISNNLCIGKNIKISINNDIENKHLVNFSKTEHLNIQSYGFSDVSIKLNRYYENENKFLQILNNTNNEIIEITLFKLFSKIDPKTNEELLKWINEENGIFGQKNINIDNNTYTRSWEKNIDSWISPLSLKEIIETKELHYIETKTNIVYEKENEIILLSYTKNKGIYIYSGIYLDIEQVKK